MKQKEEIVSKTLGTAGSRTQTVVSPTTTTKLASRMLAASTAIAAKIPKGFFSNPALDILLMLHVAEEEAHYLSVGEIKPSGIVSTSVTQRWIEALEKQGLIDRCGDLLALSSDGDELLSDILQSVFDAQRALD